MTRYALVVGIAEYDSGLLPNLTKLTADAEAVAQLLEQSGNFQEVKRLPARWNRKQNCHEVAARRLASEKLEQALRKFLLEQATKSEALIYLSGYGITVSDHLGRQMGYLATSDCMIEADGQQIVEQWNGLSLDSLNKLIGQSDLRSLVLLLDCCHGRYFLKRNLVEQTLTCFNSRQDYFLITACRNFELADENRASEEYSPFTEALLDGLSQENADSKGRVNSDHLFNFVTSELRGSGQEPIHIGWGRSITLVQYQTSIQLDLIPNQKYRGLTYQYLRICINSPDGIIDPEVLDGLELPNKFQYIQGVVIEGKAPIWLYSYLLHECRTNSWVGCYDPKLDGAVIVNSRMQDILVGSVLNKNSAELERIRVRHPDDRVQLLVRKVYSRSGSQYQCLKIGISELIEPSVLNGLKLPNDLDLSQGVVLWGRAPIWLYCYLVLHCKHAPWVGCYSSSLGSFVVVASRSNEMCVGDVVELINNEAQCPAILIGGPPDSGKSVFCYALNHTLRHAVPDKNIHLHRATWDGIGNWYFQMENRVLAEELSQRSKG